MGLTPLLNDGVGSIYLHSSVSFQKSNTRVLVDGKPVQNFEKLDLQGLRQDPGEHEIEFINLPKPTPVAEIDYQLEKNKSVHFYYCEGDGSLHVLSSKTRVLPADADEVCKPPAIERP